MKCEREPTGTIELRSRSRPELFWLCCRVEQNFGPAPTVIKKNLTNCFISYLSFSFLALFYQLLELLI